MAVALRVVSVESLVFEGEVDGRGRPFLICQGVEGELGILPQHTPLLTILRPGPLLIRNGAEETELFVGGGFLEILPDRVTVLADAAERAEDISEESAERARHEVQAALAGEISRAEQEALLQSLEMAEARLRLVRRRGNRS
ncbi:MAG TPA: ATP synthase F1 subunit epsilon [Candidatus Acidoferrales bacterium]|nr:ATP synthase F1 subunit epsilon [Candidatus Acidoferrales bacterium]